MRSVAPQLKVDGVRKLQAGLAAAGATLIAVAHLHRRHTAMPPLPGFQVPADQLPTKILNRLRHPSAPAYLVTWDRTTHASRWQPTPEAR